MMSISAIASTSSNDVVRRDTEEFVADCRDPLLVEVAQRAHLKLRGQACIALFDMTAADTASDHRDGPAFGHVDFLFKSLIERRSSYLPSFSAIAWAVSASSMALKQRACGMAVSVRLRTSAMSWRP